MERGRRLPSVLSACPAGRGWFLTCSRLNTRPQSYQVPIPGTCGSHLARAFAGVTEPAGVTESLRWGPYPESPGWALNAVTSLLRREEPPQRRLDALRGEGAVTTQAEIGVMRPPAKASWQPPEGGRAEEPTSLEPSEGTGPADASISGR